MADQPTDPLSLRAMAERAIELAAKVAKAAPGEWYEEAYNDTSDGRSYRQSVVQCNDGAVCDTLNAHFCFDEDDRQAIGLFIAFAREALPALAQAYIAQSSWANEKAEMERRLAGARTVMMAARLYLYQPQTPASWQFETVMRDVDNWLARHAKGAGC
jgi:3-methyladenine DNA glycosylase AlkD